MGQHILPYDNGRAATYYYRTSSNFELHNAKPFHLNLFWVQLMEVYDSAMSKPLYGIHQERTDTLNLNSIANKFAQQMRGGLLSSDIFKGTQSRYPYTTLVVNQLWIWLNKLLQLLRPDPARLPPLPGTQPLAIHTSQCLLLSIYYTALFSFQDVSTTHAQ